MKSKIVITVVFAAMILLSLSFTYTQKKSSKQGNSSKEVNNEPIGGFVSESKF